MALNLLKNVVLSGNRGVVGKLAMTRLTSTNTVNLGYTGSLFEPDYLNVGKPTYPQTETMNLQIKGYDFTVLEKYQFLAWRIIDSMDLDIEERYPYPPQILTVNRYKPQSSATDTTYKIKIYERNIVIDKILSIKYPILLRTLEAALPPGVTIKLSPFDQAVYDKRYVPDTLLLQMQKDLEELRNNKS